MTTPTSARELEARRRASRRALRPRARANRNWADPIVYAPTATISTSTGPGGRKDANSVSGSSTTTASIATSAGNKVLIGVGHYVSSGTPNTPTISGFTQIGTSNNGTIVNTNDARITFFYKDVPNGETSTYTISFAGQTQADGFYIVDEIVGAQVGGGTAAFPQGMVNSNGTTNTRNYNMAALANAKSLLYVMWFTADNETVTLGTGWQRNANWNIGGPTWASGYKNNNTVVVDATWTNVVNMLVSCIEIRTY